MTAKVRCFAHDGMIAAHIANQAMQLSTNAVWLLRQPRIANETLTCTTGTAATSSSDLSSSNATRLLNVQVQSGKRVHYRITPNGRSAEAATADDPILHGDETLHFCTGWHISFLESSE